MKTDRNGQSNSFRAPLLELVIVIGIFAVISVYLLQMFMMADRLRGKAVATSKGLVRAESVAEFIRGSKAASVSELKSKVSSEFGAVEEGDLLIIRYTKGWEKAEKNGEYLLKVEITEGTDKMFTGSVSVVSGKNDTEYCNLDIAGMLE